MLINDAIGHNQNVAPSTPFADANCNISGPLLTSNDPNQLSAIFSDTDCANCGASQLLATPFTPTNELFISEICWVGGFLTGCTPTTFPDFVLTIYNDNGGVPDMPIEGPITLVSEHVLTGTTLFGSDEIASSASFDPILLTAGEQIWIGIHTNSDPGCSYFWEGSSTGGIIASTLDLGDTWRLSASGSQVSFFLGEFVPQSTPIPTLGEWGLICLSMVLLTFGIVAIRREKVVLG